MGFSIFYLADLHGLSVLIKSPIYFQSIRLFHQVLVETIYIFDFIVLYIKTIHGFFKRRSKYRICLLSKATSWNLYLRNMSLWKSYDVVKINKNIFRSLSNSYDGAFWQGSTLRKTDKKSSAILVSFRHKNYKQEILLIIKIYKNKYINWNWWAKPNHSFISNLLTTIARYNVFLLEKRLNQFTSR